LQRACVSWRFDSSNGSPPAAIDVMWSTSSWASSRITPPQIPHVHGLGLASMILRRSFLQRHVCVTFPEGVTRR
jgi:hypothetical protein